MYPRFGIKVGNSTLCISTVKNGGASSKPEVIANKQGDRVSQACAFIEEGNEFECGLTAKQKMASKPNQTIANSFQLLLPKEFVDKQEVSVLNVPANFNTQKHIFEVATSRDPENEKRVEVGIEEVLTELFKSEFELAKQQHLEEAENPIVVISMPTYYPSEVSKTIKRCAEEAGFTVGQVIHETTAAILPYAQENDFEKKYVLCIKSGGLFTSIALYYVQNGFYSVEQTFGPYSIGGDKFTEVLIDYIAQEFFRKYKLDINESKRARAKARTAAENCKNILTTLPNTQIYIDSLMDGVDFNMQITRARFEMLVQPILTEYTKILGNSAFEEIELSDVILLGGTMKVPVLQETIRNIFKKCRVHFNLHSPDEIAAIGCSLHATNLDNDRLNESAEPYEGLNANIYIWHSNNVNEKKLILPIGTPIPHSQEIQVEAEKDNVSVEEEELFNLEINCSRENKSTVLPVHVKRPNFEENKFSLNVKLDKNENGIQIHLNV